jgi:iron complex transport system ATP-binding protein
MAAPLQVDNASFAYGEGEVLSDLAFTVPEASVWAVAGPNGSGKSTLVRLLAGQLVPRAGGVRVFGEDAARLPRIEIARRVAYLPQDFDVAFPDRKSVV